jgi:hypothetical protein
MTTEKYEQAIDLISTRFGVPDLAYQSKIVSDFDKQKIREVILGIKENISKVCDRVEPGKNNIIIPFNDIITKSLPKQRAFDMTTATRLFGFLCLLPIVNFDKRPRITVRKKGNPIIQTILFTLFEDLKEATFLMQYADGVRPYVLEWYYDVFLKVYNAKTVPDFKDKDNKIITEKRIAVTTEQLIEKSNEVYGQQQQSFTSKTILDNYIYPLINQNYIDKTESELDKRSNIYYPVIATTTKYIKLFENDQSNNSLQQTKISVIEFTTYPDKQYLISKIQQVLEYYSTNSDLELAIKSHEDKGITVEELVDQYYKDSEKYFEIVSSNTPEDPSAGEKSSLTTEDKSESDSEHKEIQENNFAKGVVYDGYQEGSQNNSKLQEKKDNNGANLNSEEYNSKKLFESGKTNNLIYSNEVNCQDKKYQPSVSSIKSTPITTLPDLSEQIHRANIIQQAGNKGYYPCVYCNGFETKIQKEYERHIVTKHPGHLACPTEVDLNLNDGRIKRARN